MNKFTKEELIELMDYCNDWVPTNEANSHFRKNLWLKLKSMIDKYCEHDSGNPMLSLVKECNKCGQYSEHKLWENLE